MFVKNKINIIDEKPGVHFLRPDPILISRLASPLKNNNSTYRISDISATMCRLVISSAQEVLYFIMEYTFRIRARIRLKSSHLSSIRILLAVIVISFMPSVLIL